MFTGFTPQTGEFLMELSMHNYRSWFEEHRPVFQKSLKVSGNLIARSVDIRKEEQELIGDYYKNRTSPTNTESVSCVFSGEDGSFTLNTKWSSYSRQNASIFYFGDGTTGYENRSSAMSDGGDEQ